MAGTCVFRIIIPKLGYRQEFYLIILFIIDKNLKVSLHNAILPLYLAVFLKIKNNGELPFDAKEIIEQQPEY